MKIVTAREMAQIERLAYAQGASEENFMDRAGQGVADCVEQFMTSFELKRQVTLLCGPGNNGADAYVAGQYLKRRGLEVTALNCAFQTKTTPLCELQREKFRSQGGKILSLTDKDEIVFEGSLLVDGLLGTGFHGEVEGVLQKVIISANQSQLPIISIDIPSGINGTTGEVSKVAIKATKTLFLGLPKSGCFYPEAWEHVGAFDLFNFGLDDRLIKEGQEEATLISDSLITSLLPPLKRTRHKYQAGYVIGLGGSLGMSGAPIMASFAALRSGAGIVRLFHPKEISHECTQAPLEIIREGYEDEDLSSILKELERADALFIGPGMGRKKNAVDMLKKLMPLITKPCVIDADALAILSGHTIAFPPSTILTPHHGEMKKLLFEKSKHISFKELLERSSDYAVKHQITLILKGSPTYIIDPHSKPFICPHGDPGMATAGCGDVLTGIVAAFLAQTKDRLSAALLGVQFHAKAGELAAAKWSSQSMIATDILDHLQEIFKLYTHLKNPYV